MTRKLLDTPPRTCEHCGETYERKPNEEAWKFNRRRFCGVTCVNRWKAARGIGGCIGNLDALRKTWENAARRRQTVIEDLEWIIDTDAPERVAHRLGYDNPHSLERMLQRWGRQDLAAKLRVETAA